MHYRRTVEGAPPPGGRHYAAIQRERILRAMAEVAAERGYAQASLSVVIARAGVSRRTFYRFFESREECFLSLIDLGLQRTVELVAGAFAREKCWQDGVRAALASLLVFLDSEPMLARVWLVESLAAGSWALERRERNVAALRALVISSWPASGEWSAPPLAAEGVMGSVLGVIHTHMVTGKRAPLIELMGPLMGLVVRPYLSPQAAAREVERGAALAQEIQVAALPGEHPGDVAVPLRRHTTRLHVAIPAMLSNPNSQRARHCVLFLTDHPGSSNREVAAGIGVAHESQISRLLSSLLKERLVARRSAGAGKPNAWRLTSRGEEISRALRGEGTRQ